MSVYVNDLLSSHGQQLGRKMEPIRLGLIQHLQSNYIWYMKIFLRLQETTHAFWNLA